MARTWPALRIQLPDVDRIRLGHLLWAVLDDLRPTAIDDQSEANGLVVAYFAAEDARAHAADRVLHAFDNPALAVLPVDVDDEGWAERSQAALKAVRVGRLTIAPPWDCPIRTAGTIVIVPSMGFGTGHHASTRLCLSALQRLTLTNRTVIDIGTGSGVLAVAAVTLGAASAIAVDADEDAIACALENAAANGVAGRVTCEWRDVGALMVTAADVVLANLTGSLLMSSAADLERLTRPGGYLVLSGVLETEEDDVVSALEGFADLVSREADGEWIGLLLKRRAAA